MKKLIILLLACTACLLFTACANVQLDCGIDESNNAYIKAFIQMDTAGFRMEDIREIRGDMQRLAAHYRDTLGYTVQDNLSEDETVFVLDMSLNRSAENPSAAFEQLKLMLTDTTLTPFTTVDMTQTEEEFHRAYAVKLTLSADKLLQSFNTDDFPKDLQTLFKQKLAESSSTLRVQLPAAEADSYTGTLEQDRVFTAVTTPISFENETTVSLVAKSGTPKALEKVQAQEEYFILAIRIAAALCAVFVLLFLFQLIRRHKWQRNKK